MGPGLKEHIHSKEHRGLRHQSLALLGAIQLKNYRMWKEVETGDQGQAVCCHIEWSLVPGTQKPFGKYFLNELCLFLRRSLKAEERSIYDTIREKSYTGRCK